MRRIGQKILAALLVVSCLASVAGCGKKTRRVTAGANGKNNKSWWRQ